MKQRKLLRLVAVLAAVGLTAAACGGKKSGSSSGGSSTSGGGKEPAAAPGFDPAAKTIHLGVITPLTGPVAAIGKPLTAGTETWFKYVNEEKGGIAGKYKVVLDEEDSQYNPTLGVLTRNTTWQPLLFNCWIWAVKSAAPCWNLAFVFTVKPSCLAAKSTPA